MSELKCALDATVVVVLLHLLVEKLMQYLDIDMEGFLNRKLFGVTLKYMMLVLLVFVSVLLGYQFKPVSRFL
tara:strand:+ start:1380 stop:1595 length:216 start_codon:yes stop_codon:yes gene_type:complete